MKRIFAILFLTLLTTSLNRVPAYAQGEVSVVLNGEKLVYNNVYPMIIGNRTMVPMRETFEYLGMEVEWDQTTLTANAKNDKYTVSASVEENYIYSNRNAYFCDVPPVVVEGRMLLPLRALSQAIDSEVIWDEDNMTVYVNTDFTQDISDDVPLNTIKPSKTPKPKDEQTLDTEKIIINPEEAVLNLGEKKTVRASIKNMRDETYTWSSSNSDVAAVNEKGVVTAVSKGEAYIKATGNSSGLTAECRIRAVYDYDTKINLGSDKKVLFPGETDEITWSVSGKRKDKCKMSFKSDNKDVAVVNNKGMISAKGTGTALITITDTESGAKRVCVVKVKETDPPEAEISVSTLGANPKDKTSYSGYTTVHNPGTAPGFFIKNQSKLPITAEGEARLITSSCEETIYLCRVNTSSEKITKLKSAEIDPFEQSLIQFAKYDAENERYDGFKMERNDKIEMNIIYANTRYKLEIMGNGGYSACILAK